MSSKKSNRQERRASERKLKKTISSEVTKPKDSNQSKGVTSNWIYGLIAIVITFICFSNVGGLDFVNWDDDKNFSENPAVVNFNMGDFAALTSDIFSSHVIGN